MNRILVVDDSVECLDILSELLEPLYDVRPCVESKQVLDLMQLVKFDLIILDVQMPKLNGLELLQKN